MTLGVPTDPVALLRNGQAHEARGEIDLALRHYDEAIARLREHRAVDPEARRQLGVAWMNRGNALQKQNDAALAVAAYDEAIALLQELPPTHEHRNHLGAAWLNRGHALIGNVNTARPEEAVTAFEKAIAILSALPCAENPAYALNLAGAWTNLGHTQIVKAPSRARAAAGSALALVRSQKVDALLFAEMDLRARRMLVLALGELLRVAEAARAPLDALASEAGDAIDEGLATARLWDARGFAQLRPLALRLFRLGMQLYGRHQPHFLAEFILENIDPEQPINFSGDEGFFQAAKETVAETLDKLSRRPCLLVADSSEGLRLLEIAQDLRALQDRLARLPERIHEATTEREGIATKPLKEGPSGRRQ